VLLREHGVALAGVFDTQVAFGLLTAFEPPAGDGAPDDRALRRIRLGPLLERYGFSHPHKAEVEAMFESGEYKCVLGGPLDRSVPPSAA
jgi:hypothetical protein